MGSVPKTLGDELLDRVREQFPYPVAQAARRLQAAQGDARPHEALQLGNTLIITLGTIALAWSQHRYVYPDGVVNWYAKLGRTLTLGDWLGAARGGAVLARATGAPLAGLESALGGERSRLLTELQGLVKLRNDFTHGRGATVGAARFEPYAARLDAALREAEFLTGAQFALVERSDRQRPRGYRVAVWRATGDHPVFLRRPAFTSPEALYSDALYLLQEQGDDLDLTPFWIARKDAVADGWEVLHLDKRVGQRSSYRSFTRPGAPVPEDDLPVAHGWFEHGPWATPRFRPAPMPARLFATDQPLSSDRIDLARLYERTLASMLEKMSVDEATGGKGWNANLDLLPITTVATAIGLRIVRLAAQDLSLLPGDELLETLWKLQVPGGCWASSSRLSTARPDGTATVLLAFWSEGAWERARSMIAPFERMLQPHRDIGLWGSTWSMTLAISTLSVLQPTSEVLAQLVEVLEDAAIRDGRRGVLGWSRFTRLHPGFDEQVEPSAAHTAKVLLALRHCRGATDGRLGAPPEELDPAVHWLLRAPHWDNVDEEIERPIGGGRSERLLVRHFTGPWVVRALLDYDVDPGNDRIGATIGELYESQEDGLWDWSLPGGPLIRRPVWATLDALRALQAYTTRAARNPRSAARR
jgi:hypothetical protein